jgi:hypothetical protein
MTRASIGALAVASLALLGSMNSYQVSRELAARYPDAYGVAAAERRFEGALEILPPSAVVGYISDLPMSQNAGITAFLAAQYAVAPRGLVPLDRSRTEWVVGNFARAADFTALGAQSGLTMVRDFGNGVVVYRRPKA